MIIVSALRFILSLCIPMLEVLLHTIIDELRVRNAKVVKIEEKLYGHQRWKKEEFWIKVARKWLPIAYLTVALAILVSGIVHALTSC